MTPTDKVIFVSKSIIRQKFNNGPYLLMIKKGDLVPKCLKNTHLENPKTFQGPYCTHSQIIRYTNSFGKIIVLVHQYLRPNGTFGASGMPDPKRLREGNIIYAVL